MRWRVPVLLLALLSLFGPGGVGAQSARPLSMKDAARLVIEHSHVLQQAHARTLGARARFRQAAALQNPTLSLATHAGQNTGGLDEDILLTQVFQLGARRSGPIASAAAELAAAEWQERRVQADVTQAAETAYVEALRAAVELDLAVETCHVAELFAQAAQAQFDSGDVARSNVVRSRIELARAGQAQVAAQAESDNRLATLASLVGAGDRPALADSLAFVPLTFTQAQLVAHALEHAPDVRAAHSLCLSREAAVRTARGQGTPDLFVEGRHQYLNPFTGGSSIRVGVTFPLLDLGASRAGVAMAEAAVQEQRAAEAEVRRVVELDVTTSWRSVEAARVAVESFQRGRLARSRELLEMMRSGYKMGATSYLELLDAQRVYQAEQVDYARALAAYQNAVANLRHAVGGTLP